MDVNINVKIQKDRLFVHVMLDFDWMKTKENAMVCKVLASQVFRPLERSEFELTIYSNFTLNLNFSSFFRT